MLGVIISALRTTFYARSEMNDVIEYLAGVENSFRYKPQWSQGLVLAFSTSNYDRALMTRENSTRKARAQQNYLFRILF